MPISRQMARVNYRLQRVSTEAGSSDTKGYPLLVNMSQLYLYRKHLNSNESMMKQMM